MRPERVMTAGSGAGAGVGAGGRGAGGGGGAREAAGGTAGGAAGAGKNGQTRRQKQQIIPNLRGRIQILKHRRGNILVRERESRLEAIDGHDPGAAISVDGECLGVRTLGEDSVGTFIWPSKRRFNGINSNKDLLGGEQVTR